MCTYVLLYDHNTSKSNSGRNNDHNCINHTNTSNTDSAITSTPNHNAAVNAIIVDIALYVLLFEVVTGSMRYLILL